MFFKVVLLGIIEGVTEFLPISSTGHLILVSDYLTMDKAFYEVFNIAIQLGAICAVFFLFPSYFSERIRQFKSKETVVIMVAVLPILVMGYLLKDVIKAVLFSPSVIFWGLIVGGVGLIIADKKVATVATDDHKESVSLRQALMVGLWQCLALWPGMSRSAMTILGGLAGGLNRVTSASFSFIIAVPVMVVVVGYDLVNAWSSFSAIQLAWIALGMVISFVVALATMRWFLAFINRQGLLVFGVYRIVLGGLGMLFFV
jgi:undecaprenyl-diphosphatase